MRRLAGKNEGAGGPPCRVTPAGRPWRTGARGAIRVSGALLLIVGLLVHATARFAAFCAPVKVDSFLYAVAAYRFWRPDATAADLIADKPPGQAFLSGWVYRVSDGPPTRLPLVPIESAFLLAGYGFFWVTAHRLLREPLAAAATLFLIIGHNVYNVTDFTTDGFNLNESYLAAPMLLAVLAHLTVRGPAWRGLLRGIGLGLALTIKQTAVTLPAAMLLHALLRRPRRRETGPTWTSLTATVVGAALAVAPLLSILIARGWVGSQFASLWTGSGRHLTLGADVPGPTYRVLPLAPAAGWIVLGGLAVLRRVRPNRPSPTPQSDRDPWVFAVLWLAAELTMLALMTKPSSHYYQQVAGPAVLVAGLAMGVFVHSLDAYPPGLRRRILGWTGAATAVLAALAVTPLMTSGWQYRTFRRDMEVQTFQAWLYAWPDAPTRGRNK